MKINYNLGQQFIACILAISLFLQGCGNFSNPIIPGEDRLTNDIQESTNQIATDHLVDKELTAEGGYLVTFYEQNSQLQADVRVDEKQKEPNYKNLPVIIDQDIDLAQLPHLNKAEQKRLIHFNASKNGNPGSVSIIRNGLLGGMIREDESEGEGEKEAEYMLQDEHIPNECFCPITQEIMENPVIAQDGHTYESSAIKRWLDMGKRTSPKTGARLLSTELTPNYTLRSLIQDLKERLSILARHQLISMDNIEAAIKLREEEIQQKLELKGSLLQQEQQKVADLEEQLKKLELQQQQVEEVVVVLGNIGVGKSTIYNTMLQKAAFSSSISDNEKEVTINQQTHIHNKKLYIEIDTPGLSDEPGKWSQTAATIEKALQHNNNYKIVFVVTLETGKIRPEDVINIETVCNAINVPSKYGLIFNKATQEIMEDISKRGLESYLTPLKQKPYASVILKMDDENSKEEENKISLNSENRNKLIEFFSKLPGGSILQKDFKPIDTTGLQEKVSTLSQIARHEKLEIEMDGRLQVDINNYFIRHASKKNIDWNNLILPQELYTRPKLKQAEAVAKLYKDLLYDKSTRYGGWLLLARTCYLRNRFAKLLSPEQMGLTIIEPKHFKDKNYDKQLIRYLRDGLLTLSSLKGHTINPPYAVMELKNNSDKDITFIVQKGQVFEVSRFEKIQNLAIAHIVKVYKDSYGNVFPIENWELDYDQKEDIVKTIKANSVETVTYLCRCINPTNASPVNVNMNPTNQVKEEAAKQMREDPKVTGPVKIDNEVDPGDLY
jgi:ribosome biogenesis GTPase A